MGRTWLSLIEKLDRVASWILVAVSATMFISGYIITRRFFSQLSSLWFLTRTVHVWFEWLFLALFVFHFFTTVFLIRFRWRNAVKRIWSLEASSLLTVKFVQRVTGWAILLPALLVVVSGLGWYNIGRIVPFTQHLRYDIYLFLAITVHVACGAKMALSRRKMGRRLSNLVILSFVMVLSLVVLQVDSTGLGGALDLPEKNKPESPSGTKPPLLTGTITIGNDLYTFDPGHVETIRPDIFNPGFFSMFDVLVHLDRQEKIELAYHFDASMNTHIIDTINREPDWWYQAYYDGGWSESNVFRPDHYPWKDKTTLAFFKTDPSRLQDIHSVWKEETERLTTNNGELVIPRVIIRGLTFAKEFENVEMTPHNLRDDVFRHNVTTAIDVIMSLSDQEKITYELKWYETIGTAGIVKDYWVEAIDDDESHDRCGFVYEAGSPKYTFFRGNHIHLPSDIRVLNSPEYVEFFWICI
jgi:hypothetical protein